MTEISFDELELGPALGAGGFGVVHVARWHHALCAVKMVSNQKLSDSAIRQMREEVKLHEQLRFPFIVQLLGACTVKPNCCMVMELASGNLFGLLHEEREKLLPLNLRVSMLYDVARGMDYLHSRRVLHRDLKSLNLLIFQDRTVKICDFGLSRVKNECTLGASQRVGTASWMAPEILDDSQMYGRRKLFTEKSDVYSFAMVMHEVMARAIPYEGQRDKQIMRFLTAGNRLELPPVTTENPVLANIITICWADPPMSRPSFSKILPMLQHQVEEFGDPRMETPQNAEARLTDIEEREADLRRREQELEEELARIRELEDEQRQFLPPEDLSPPAPASSRRGIRHFDSRVEDCGDTDTVVLTREESALTSKWEGGETDALPPSSVFDDLWTRPDDQSHHLRLRGILQQIRRETGQGGGVDNWVDGVPLAQWEGVELAFVGERAQAMDIVKLELPHCALCGPVPLELFWLRHIQVLNLQGNDLQGPIPDHIGDMSALRFLSLRTNLLTGAIPHSIGRCQNLRELYLFQNKLSSELPQELCNLTDLLMLMVFENDLSGPLPTDLGRLKSLIIFSAHTNQLRGKIPRSIVNMSALMRLELQDNKLTGTIPKEIGQLHELQYLHLHRNRLTGTVPESLSTLSNLKFLNLGYNALTGQVPKSLSKLQSLQRLQLQRNQFSGQMPLEIQDMPSIELLKADDHLFS
mmetsp:Transcript_300/g.970  ORF Transcript_300/g.970 Transcript_300/m.970 type:complete len:698 (-) Transcript_300:277-2370(-)